ncbi:hypothetical protein KH5_13820 [Urechidicola sp. KH5]
MKKTLLPLVLFCTVLTINAQNNDFEKSSPKQAKHEIKLNALYSLLAIPEISYEYLLNEDSALGASVLLALNDDTDLNFAFTPYYRFYFGDKPTAGFFIEGFGMYSTRDDYDIVTNDFALGLGLGGKFLSKNGFVGELYVGVGRNLFGNHDIEGIPRIGISIGKRF